MLFISNCLNYFKYHQIKLWQSFKIIIITLYQSFKIIITLCQSFKIIITLRQSFKIIITLCKPFTWRHVIISNVFCCLFFNIYFKKNFTLFFYFKLFMFSCFIFIAKLLCRIIVQNFYCRTLFYFYCVTFIWMYKSFWGLREL